MADVLGIHSWDDTQGRTWFRARGTGIAYQRLYEWLRTVKFADHYLGHEDEVEEVDEVDPAPLDPRMAGLIDQFADMLFAELQKERDAEILAAIREASR